MTPQTAYDGSVNLLCRDNPVSPPRRRVGHSENLFLNSGAAEGCGGSLQESCLEEFDTLGLHQLSRYSEMVSPDVWDVEAQVRFLLPRPSFVSVSK